jgi:BarA-like signal transduction histidine kinase
MTLYVIDLFVDYVMTTFRRNLTIRELSLDKALEIAVAMET